jgi:membrane protein DedA with SNARE-associated domain
MDSLAGLLPWFLQYGYFALFFLLLFGDLYLPLPSNLALLGAGVLSHISVGGLHFNFFIAAIIGFVACVLGDTIAYFLSRSFTSPKRRARAEVRHSSYRKVAHHLRAHPIITVSATRLIGFLSPLTSSLSGFSKLPYRIFIVGDVIGNAACVLIYMWVGYTAESVSGNLVELLSFASGILLIFGVIYAGSIIFLREK